MSKKKFHKAKGASPKPARKAQNVPRRNVSSSAAGFPQPAAAKPHFSLQDEARFTGGRQGFWTIDTKLRNRRVHFISAGLHSTMENEEAEEDMESSTSPSPAVRGSDLNDEGDSGAEQNAQKGANPSTTTSEVIAAFSPVPAETTASQVASDNLSSGVHSPQIPSMPPELFFVDTVGDPHIAHPAAHLHLRSPSPARSDSSDEVVFHGRREQARVVDDPVQPSSHGTAASSTLVTTVTIAPGESSWDDTSVDWVHRSKPGIGWSIPRDISKISPQSQLLTFRAQEQPPDFWNAKSAEDDYLDNLQAQGVEFANYAFFAQRDIDAELGEHSQVNQKFQTLSVSGTKQGQPHTGRQMLSEAQQDVEVEESEDDATDVVSESDEVSDTDADVDDTDELGGSEDEDAPSIHAQLIDDGTLAQLLAKQEELGLGSEELLLYSEDVEASIAGAAKRYQRENPQKSRRSKGGFPSATLLADVLEQDPYGGFDIMDFDRPSLRKKKGKARLGDPDLGFDLSDEELRQGLQETWANDRSKKKARKMEREEQRMQGLFDHKNVASKYGEGMTIWQIGKEFESFLGSDDLEEKAFPPMDKRRRKMIHEIATEFNLKTKSIGAGNNRYTKIIKTKTTTRFSEIRFAARARRINLGFFPRTDVPMRGKRAKNASASGGNSSAIRYRDGDVVGATAPEIGAENRGRAMLEKMGWSSGMALGTHDNKGILEPIAQIIKNTKSGLG